MADQLPDQSASTPRAKQHRTTSLLSFGQKAIGLAAVQHASHKASEHEAKEEVKERR
jgi:hypothetical protein